MTRPDQVSTKILKLIGDKEITVLRKLFNSDWLKSTFVMIPKKSRATRCNDHRTIILISHVLKIFMRVIHGRTYKKLEERVGSRQFSFRNGLGTRQALFGLNVLIQRGRQVVTCSATRIILATKLTVILFRL